MAVVQEVDVAASEVLVESEGLMGRLLRPGDDPNLLASRKEKCSQWGRKNHNNSLLDFGISWLNDQYVHF